MKHDIKQIKKELKHERWTIAAFLFAVVVILYAPTIVKFTAVKFIIPFINLIS